jgi:hypothetical protein
MVKVAAVLVLVGLFAQVGYTQSSSATFLNGRTWNTMSDEVKTWYLLGFKDGLGLSQTIEKFWGSNLNVNDFKKELDKVYNEGENVEVPIWMAVRYVSVKLDGTHTASFLDAFLIDLRKVARATGTTPK